jgi:dienelactone hydrolase
MPGILIPATRGSMPAYLSVPRGSGPFPGVVVLHDVGGASEDLRNQADWLAAEGFLALASELFHHGGPLPPDADNFLATACPVIGSYGARDRWNQGVADQLERALTRALVAHDVKEYPGVGHSFLNNHNNIVFKVMRFAGVASDHPATLDARRRIAAFFHAHLG